MERPCRYVFGPVPSRRLGRSLGIDLVPFKTCSYDCIYCQLGRTTNRTVERREYVPLGAVLEELDGRLAAGPEPDYVTLSGAGEPTLYSRLGSLISGIKERTDRPVAVLTNGSLLSDPDVQDSLMGADLVLPSLDAGDDATFQWVNRPHPALSFERMVAGLKVFCQRFPRPVWLEVFLLRALNAAGVQLERIIRLVDRIAPDRVQLNTATRPASEDFALAVAHQKLRRIARAFGDRADVIADCRVADPDEHCQARREDVLNLVMRRPCTLDEAAVGLGLDRNEAAKHLAGLVRERLLVCERDGRRVYYQFAAHAGRGRSPDQGSKNAALSDDVQGE